MVRTPEHQAEIEARRAEHEERDRLAPPTHFGGAFERRYATTTPAGGRPAVRWSMHPRAVLMAYDERTHTLAECAREAEVTTQTIRNRFHRAGVAFLPQSQGAELRAQRFELLHTCVITADEIARLTADGRMTVRRLVFELHSHPRAVVTWEYMLADRAAGELVALPDLDVEEGSAAPRGPQRGSRPRRNGPPRVQWSITITEAIRRYEVERESLDIIARSAGVSRSTVRGRFLEHGVELRPCGPPPVRIGNRR